MAIKVPDNFRPSDYGVKISIPKPDIECRKNEDGSFSMYAGYSCDSISDLVREAAREINDKMEAELIDELLRMNGYVPERTCRYEPTNRCTHVCTSCGREVEMLHLGYNYCPNCGAKVDSSFVTDENTGEVIYRDGEKVVE